MPQFLPKSIYYIPRPNPHLLPTSMTKLKKTNSKAKVKSTKALAIASLQNATVGQVDVLPPQTPGIGTASTLPDPPWKEEGSLFTSSAPPKEGEHVSSKELKWGEESLTLSAISRTGGGHWTLNAGDSLGSATYVPTQRETCGELVSRLAQNPRIVVSTPRSLSQVLTTSLPSAPDSLVGDTAQHEDEAIAFPWDVATQEGHCWCCEQALVRRTDGPGAQCVSCWAGQILYS